MANIDIASLFSDIVPDPVQQQRERTLQQNDAVNQANLVGTLGGMAAYLAPERSRALQQSATGLLGIEQPTSAADQVKAQLAAASSQKQTPESLIRLAKLVENSDPQKAAQFRQAAVEMDAQDKGARQAQDYRNLVANRAVSSARFKGDAVSIVDGTMPSAEVTRIYNELTKEKDPKTLDHVQAVLPDQTQITVLSDGEGGYYDVTDPTKKLNIAKGTQIFTASQVGTPRDYADPQEVILNKANLGTAQFVSTANNVIRMLEAAPDANTNVASIASYINDFIQEGEALLNWGNEGERKVLMDKLQLGDRSNEMQSVLVGLAYQAARAEGQEGRDVQQADLERFIRQLGADKANPTALITNLKRLKKEAKFNFGRRFLMVRGNEWEGSFEPEPVNVTTTPVAVPAGTPNAGL